MKLERVKGNIYYLSFLYIIIITTNATLSPGLVADGELNSLQTQGETRPLHIWQHIHDARIS